MSMQAKGIIWAQFATAAVQGGIKHKIPDVAMFATLLADKLTSQWDARFGDAAFLLEGQRECGNCKKSLPEGAAFTPSADGVKFCGIPCLKSSGREE